MQKTIKLLAVILLAQLILTAAVYLSVGSGDGRTGGLLLPGLSTPDRIVLQDADGASVTLAQKDGVWVLPQQDDFPANAGRVKRLIERLGALKTGLPVATTDSARRRFKVAEEDFERRIELFGNGGGVTRLFLGTSPSMRRIHARLEGRDEIHVVQMALHEVPVKPVDWEDKTVLGLNKGDISRIEVNGITLTHDKAWQAGGIEAGRMLKPEAAEKLADLLRGLRIEKVLGRAAKPEYGLDQPVLRIGLTRKNGAFRRYVLGRQDDDNYILKASDRPEYFRLAAYRARALIEASRPDKLTAAVDQPPPTGQAGATTDATP